MVAYRWGSGGIQGSPWTAVQPRELRNDLRETRVNPTQPPWRGGAQGLESTKLHPPEQGFPRRALDRPGLWIARMPLLGSGRAETTGWSDRLPGVLLANETLAG